MDIKITAEVKIDEIANIIDFIRKKVHELNCDKLVHLKDIRISIPFWFQRMLDLYYEQEYKYDGVPKWERLFNCEVIEGYNNQICIFNSKASPEEEFLVNADFIKNFSDQFESTDIKEFTPSTKFRQLDEWTSLTALCVLSMINDTYKVRLKPDEMRKTNTIEELFEIVKNNSNE